VRWETKRPFDGKLCQEYLCQKLSKCDNCFSSYSQKCRGCFLRHSVDSGQFSSTRLLVFLISRSHSADCCGRESVGDQIRSLRRSALLARDGLDQQWVALRHCLPASLCLWLRAAQRARSNAVSNRPSKSQLIDCPSVSCVYCMCLLLADRHCISDWLTSCRSTSVLNGIFTLSTGCRVLYVFEMKWCRLII